MSDRSFRPSRAIFLLISSWLVLTAGTALAGSICGQVTDQQTGQPVAHAGIFLRDAQGAYLGQYAATDAGGDYCIDDLATGTYMIEVRVDDYVIAYVTGVEVLNTASTVPISAQLPAAWLDLPWPNPASAQVNLRLHASRSLNLDLAVHDMRGRVVRRWQGALDAGERNFVWDGRDVRGHRLPTGLYFIRLHTGERTMTRPVLLTR
jgi:hypothetical protein